MATYKGFSRIILFTLIFLNQAALLTYPMILSFKVETDQIVGGALFMYTVATCLKLISFHHTMHDVRGLVIRAIKAKETNTELTPSKIEGTILGVSQEDFDEAMTYPKCLTVKNFLRFMSSPTFCYQLVNPLTPKRNWFEIGRRLFQCLLSGLAVVYLFYQHIIPVC